MDDLQHRSGSATGEQQDIDAASSGDREAFGRLYVLHVNAVHRFLYLSGAGGVVDDLTAETFVRAFRAMPRYESRGVQFRSWLLRIATNALIEHRRRRSSGEEPTDDLALESTAPGPEGEAIVTIEQQQVAAALRRLPERERLVVVLRYLEDLPANEVAEATGLTEANVRQIARRALGALRSMLSGMERG